MAGFQPGSCVLVARNSSKVGANAATVHLSPRLALQASQKTNAHVPGQCGNQCLFKIPSTTRAALSPGTTYTRNTPVTPAIQTGNVARVLVSSVSSLPKRKVAWPSQGGSAVCSDTIFVGAYVPTSQEYLVQSRNESILCQSLPCQCTLTCCGLLRSRQRMMSSPLHHLWAFFLCSGIHLPSVPSHDRGGNVYVRSAL